MAKGRWVHVGGCAGNNLSAFEKQIISAACETLIRDVLVPRFLRQICPTQFNYPIGIHGKWHGNKYRFLTRYRSGFPDNTGEEFDSPFARLEYVTRDCFDISYYRHTDEWFCLYRRVSLAEALELIGSGDLLVPC